MTDITQYSPDELKEILDLLPGNSVVARVGQYYVAANSHSFEQTSNREMDDYFDNYMSRLVDETYDLSFKLKKDSEGVVIKYVEDPTHKIEVEAKTFYRIAEPHGKSWYLLKNAKQERYRRIAKHNLGLE